MLRPAQVQGERRIDSQWNNGICIKKAEGVDGGPFRNKPPHSGNTNPGI